MRLPVRLAVSIVPLVAVAGCLSSTEPVFVSGPPLDCVTLATSLTQSAVQGTLTTLPDGLRFRDDTIGTGATILKGQLLSVHYAGCLTPSGTRFDPIGGTPYSTLDFIVGAQSVIPGFDEGVLNMKVGGRRELVIPSALAYGASGIGSIPGNATLVFTIDAVATR